VLAAPVLAAPVLAAPVLAASVLALAAVAPSAPANASTSATSAASRVALPDPTLDGTSGTIEPLSSSQQLNLRVYLAGQDPAGLAAAALAMSTPHSADYGQYLTPAEYQQRFGPTAAQTATVTAWLEAQGMTITATTAHYVAVTATVAEADSAFDTQVSQYVTTTTGVKGGTATTSVVGTAGGFSVPAALGADVASVTGIDQTVPPGSTTGTESAALSPAAQRAKAVSAAASAAGGYQCSQYWGQYTETIPAAYGKTSAPTQLCGYTPAQLREAYGITGSSDTGKGATIAVVLDEAWPTMLSDANTFFASNDIAGFAPGQYTENFDSGWASSCGAQQEQEGGNPGDPEEAIDVETAHIAAPDAKVVLVGADCDPNESDPAEVVGPIDLQGYLDATTRIVDNHLADVITSSWGYGASPADVAAWNLVFEQGALEGIGFDYSSGDAGAGISPDSGVATPSVQFPASDPWVTAVGGTSLAIGPNGTAVADYPWGDNITQVDAAGTGYTAPPPGDFAGGSGGGTSMFAEPGYQKPVVPAALATDDGTGPALRVVPDISANAGNNWLIGYTGAEGQQGVYGQDNEGGGTSGSSPLIAGLEADAMQAAGHPLGFANPALYLLAGTPAITDVSAVNPGDPPMVIGGSLETGLGDDYLTTLGEDQPPLLATAGYDDVTGLGAPGTSFVTALGGL
jgi:subtilase family serine protease